MKPSIITVILLLILIPSPQLTCAYALDPDDPVAPETQQSTTKKHPFLLIDRQLVEKNIDLLSITKERIRYTNRLGPNATRSLNDLLILIRIDKPTSQYKTTPAPPSPDNQNQNENAIPTPDQPDPNTTIRNPAWTGPTIQLTDGRLITGQLTTITEDGNALLWRNDIIGKVQIPTDNISRIYLRSKSPATKQDQTTTTKGQGDTVELINGDRMNGFISFKDSKNITIETDRDTTTLELNRISSITLENETIPPPFDACRVFLDDGSIFDIDPSKLHTRGEGVRFIPTNFSVINQNQSSPNSRNSSSIEHWADFNSLRALAFNAGSIKPLATLTPIPESNNSPGKYESTQWFDETIPPVINNNNNQPLSLNDIRYEGPAQFHYPIPARATRFAARASIPRTALDWADFNLIILANNRELYRNHFDSNHPTDEIIITIPQPAKTLTITIEENKRGPIEDIITLHHPLYLLNKP